MFQKPRLTYYRTFFPRNMRNNYNIPTAYHRHHVPTVRPSAQQNAMAKIMALLGPKAATPLKPAVIHARPMTLNAFFAVSHDDDEGGNDDYCPKQSFPRLLSMFSLLRHFKFIFANCG
ncbi:hypothetical protein BGZ74_003471 [Mortierella antarctica]|nr:hypothetical protein BGZ74_003471 [Mortierella antarctica]